MRRLELGTIQHCHAAGTRLCAWAQRSMAGGDDLIYSMEELRAVEPCEANEANEKAMERRYLGIG